MSTIGAYEAKTRLPELLRRVGRGERIVITHHGVPLATLAPVETAPTKQPQEVIAALKAFRQSHTLGDVSVRCLIDEGRE